MAEKLDLRHPWLVAVWPGMGHVALNAGIYLLARLGMSVIAEYDAASLFDVEHVDVKGGILQIGRRPRNRFFLWNNPNKNRDLLVFMGEAQPPIGKYPFCKQLIEFAKVQGVERVLTFAAMATEMSPSDNSRVFGAATDRATLEELKRLELVVLEDGNIAGLNGLLLGVAAEAGLHGACLLGEMPHIFSQFPYPKSSLAILEAFVTMSGFDIELAEMAAQARIADEQLGQLLAQVEKAYGQSGSQAEEGDGPSQPPRSEEKLTSEDKQRLDDLFAQAAQDRAKSFELKRELDRLGVFKEYEDRFLDLFKKPQ